MKELDRISVDILGQSASDLATGSLKVPDFDNNAQDIQKLVKALSDKGWEFYYSFCYDEHTVKIIKHNRCFVSKNDKSLGEAIIDSCIQLLDGMNSNLE